MAHRSLGGATTVLADVEAEGAWACAIMFCNANVVGDARQPEERDPRLKTAVAPCIIIARHRNQRPTWAGVKPIVPYRVLTCPGQRPQVSMVTGPLHDGENVYHTSGRVHRRAGRHGRQRAGWRPPGTKRGTADHRRAEAHRNRIGAVVIGRRAAAGTDDIQPERSAGQSATSHPNAIGHSCRRAKCHP